MTSNLKLILSAVGVVALVASPAMAKSHARNHDAVRALRHIPADSRAAVDTYVPSTGAGQKVYGAEQPVSPHPGLLNPDFQLGGNRY